MNNSKIKLKILLVVSLSFCMMLQVKSQDEQTESSPGFRGDSLSITQVIEQVINNYPTVKQAEEALNAADAKIGLARSGYYPDINAGLSYTRIGPVPSISIPDFGTFSLYPYNNYDAALNVRQPIYDFGKTSGAIDLQQRNKVLKELSIGEVKQKLALTAMTTFYTMAFLQQAILIKNDELNALNEHLQFVEKKKETGSATQYEILTTKVKISGVVSQKVDLTTAFKIQTSVMNNLLGLPENTEQRVSYNLGVAVPDIPPDSILPYAMDHRDEVKIAAQKSALAQLNYQMVKKQNNPVLGLYASGGWKNGYFPNLDKITANYSAGLGLTIPLYDANRTKYNLMEANSKIHSSELETDLTGRNITNDVIENETKLKAAGQKVDQFKMQLDQAEEAYELAKTNFKAGAITNLDVLDASTSVSESHLLLLKSRIDYVMSIYRLKAAMGQRLY